ncbi:MAG: S41 family peptidase, partial [bacterium]|nr:S41 family peptidase [bacterium]
GLVLDMRNNPGGLLNQAIDIADMFLSEGSIVLTVGAENQVLEINRAHSSDADESYPVVVLVNEGSASASEIVAGAIKNNNRGVVLGKQTFGKGSVQSVYALRGGAALKITVAQYLTPGKASIQSVGITPDIKMLPISVEEKKVDLIESETFREKDLDKHLESSLAKNDKPVFTLEYYQPKKEDDEFASQYTAEIDVEKDFELKFAKQLLQDYPIPERKDVLRKGKVLVSLTEEEEAQKVANALQAIGIDWSNGPIAKGNPQAAVTFNIHSTAGQVLKAGEEIELELKVRNSGKAPFHRLIATTESDYILLKNREFIFGKIKPGETKSWKVPIKVPASALSREDKITFKFHEGNGKIPEPFQSIIRTEPIQRPSYAYTMEVLDNGQQGSHGDGDKIVEVGEKITLKVNVTNQGDGKSAKTVVNLKNLDGQGIFLNEGRVKLNELNAKENKVAILSFTVGPKFSKDQIELELVIEDKESQEVLRDKLNFPVGKGSLDPQVVGMQAGPLITLEKKPYPTKTKNNRISISGKVADPSGLKDLSVFVGENKAYLKTFENTDQEGTVNESSFVAAVDLEEEENNLITILARDKNNLTTRHSFYIYKE